MSVCMLTPACSEIADAKAKHQVHDHSSQAKHIDPIIDILMSAPGYTTLLSMWSKKECKVVIAVGFHIETRSVVQPRFFMKG